MGVGGGVLLLVPAVEAGEIWLFKRLVDDVLVPRDLAPLGPLVVLYVVLNLLSGGLSFGDRLLSAWVGGRFVLRVRAALFAHLLRASPVQLARRPLGDVLTRLSADVTAVETFLVRGPSIAVESGARLVVFVTVMVWIDPLLTAVALLAAPAFWLLARRFSAAIRDAARERRVRSGQLQSLAEEALSALGQVQAASAEEHENGRFAAEGRAVLAAEMRAARIQGAFRPLVDLFELAGGLAVVATGAWALSAGRLTLGELLAFLTYLTQLFGPVRALTDLVTSASKAAASAERVDELMDEEPIVADAPHAVAPTRPLAAALSLQDVTFAYPGADACALTGVTVRFDPGSVTAVMGPSGSGKSTLAALLVRWCDPTAGSVELDGHDLRTLPLRTVRSSVGLLLQDTHLFDGTIADNVAYGTRPGPGSLDRALHDADAAPFVEALPGGVDHRVGPKGHSLSGGQRRRLALARALHATHPILVLDEYSAGLDAATTRRIIEALRRLGRTLVLITHDPDVAAVADRVVVLDGGRIAEAGRAGVTLGASPQHDLAAAGPAAFRC
jgi:ABC-type multidrug transport system fused ATPase/permease subunit